MADKKESTERRKNKRFHVNNGIAALPISSSVIIGTIVDISKGGLAVRYASEDEELKSFFDIDILLTDTNFFMPNVSTNIITDFELENKIPFSIITERRCGLQFRQLSSEQISQLDDLLTNYTMDDAREALQEE